jgi:hypothetical protein
MSSYFDQRGQHVSNQVNVAGGAANINFQGATNQVEVTRELEQLRVGLATAAGRADFPPQVSSGADHHLARAIEAATTEAPSKRRILGHLTEARSLLASVAKAAGFVTAIEQALEAVRKVF